MDFSFHILKKYISRICDSRFSISRLEKYISDLTSAILGLNICIQSSPWTAFPLTNILKVRVNFYKLSGELLAPWEFPGGKIFPGSIQHKLFTNILNDLLQERFSSHKLFTNILKELLASGDPRRPISPLTK